MEEEEGGLEEVEVEGILPGHFPMQRMSLGQRTKAGNDHIRRLLVKKTATCAENFVHFQAQVKHEHP